MTFFTVPPTWQIEPHDVEVVMGKGVLVNCVADGSPVPKIIWKKESGLPVPPFPEIQRMENFKLVATKPNYIQLCRA